MKEFLIFLPLTILYLALKSALFPNVPAPDIPLIIIFYMASRKASIEGVLLAFVLGYVEDIGIFDPEAVLMRSNRRTGTV